MDVIYLSIETVLAFHSRALKEHGGLDGIRSQELLESAVFQAQQSAYGEDAYPDMPSKAAAYGFFIAQSPARYLTEREVIQAGFAFGCSNRFLLRTKREQSHVENVDRGS